MGLQVPAVASSVDGSSMTHTSNAILEYAWMHPPQNIVEENQSAQWTLFTRNNMASGYPHITMQRKQEWSPCQEPINSSRHVRTLYDIHLGRPLRINPSCLGRSHPPTETRLTHGGDMDRDSATQKLEFLKPRYLQKIDPVDGYGLHKLNLRAWLLGLQALLILPTHSFIEDCKASLAR